jgi:glycosyltransferase involved in cell wall biosynthesis
MNHTQVLPPRTRLDLPTTTPVARPALAIVIPVYKHSVLVQEAVISALDQETDFEFCIVLVNDGCPMPETHQACLDFVIGAPGRLHYIRRRNGGLSAARNTGIDYALGAWKTVRAIYFLDADNRLLPGALQRAYDVLLQNPTIGWVYPDIDMFGQETYIDNSGEYSILRNLDENTCEAGSLVNRTVFDAGARFDESMLLGFEDWDFWLTAVELGFRGEHLENFGFRYRRRPESMLSNSERDRPEILSYIRRKHKNLFRFDTLMALEHKEAPRYGVWLAETGEVRLTSDPSIDGPGLRSEDFFAQYFRARLAPARYPRPPFIVTIDSTFRETLNRQGLLQWAFWLLEGAIGTCSFAYMIERPRARTDPVGIVEISDTGDGEAHHRAGLAFVTTELLDQCLDDPSDSWIMSLEAPLAQPKLRTFQLSLANDRQDPPSGRANTGLLDLFRQLREFQSTIERGQSWEWRHSHLPTRARLFEITRNLLRAAPVYPRVRQDGKRQIGFVLPLAEFGGVEKTAYSLANEMHNSGWSTHLFVLCRQTARPTLGIGRPFDTLNFLCDAEVENWDPNIRYMGSHYPRRIADGRHSRALGLLCGLDAVINFHCAEAHALMMPLRREGTKTITSLQVTDLTNFDRPSGHTYLTLGYEHAYDLVLCCSQQLFDWLHAMGIPEAKLSLLRNAPSYELADGAIEEALAGRRGRDPGPLRVLFLGRLDRQKGLDRLATIIRSSRQAGLPIEWRVIGAGVLDGTGRQELEQSAIEIEPPKLTAEELTECYQWADVVLLVSRWEGLPLTILEAMRLGVVVCATAVGAVAEAVSHDENGFLLPSNGTASIAGETIRSLRRLCEDRHLLRRLSSAAAGAARAWTCQNSAKGFIAQLDRLMTG